MTPESRRSGIGRPWPAALLVIYPSSWRSRYGDELDVLISDMRAGGRRAVPMAVDLLRGAAAAWLSAKRGFAMSEHSRSALYTVLWSWVAFGAIAFWFGHDLGIYPSRAAARQIAAAHPGVPDAYHVLLAAGVAGCAATAVAAVAFAFGAFRYARAQGKPGIYWLMAVPPVSAAVWLGGLRLIPRSSQSAGHTGVLLFWLLLGVAGVAVSTQAVVTITRRCEFDERTWRLGGVMATVVTAVMLVATGATIAWGVVLHASQVRAPQGEWLIATVIMTVATGRAVIALLGSRRADLALTEPSPAA